MKPAESLWRDSSFLRFWSANTISRIGSEITFLALPIIAAVTLQATAVQMGLITAAGTLPYLLFGLFAGVVVDRFRKRPLLIVADLGRFLLIGSLPVTALIGQLTLAQIIIVTFLVGCLSLLANVAEEAFLPGLVSRSRLVEGYSKLSASGSVVELSGPALAAGLIELLTAPLALVVDAGSYLISALLLGTVRAQEPAPQAKTERPSWRQDIGDGLQFIRRHRYIRPMFLTNATMQFFGGMIDALLILYLTRTLGLPATFVGAIFAVGSLTGLAAAAVGKRAEARFGLGRMVIVGGLLIGVGSLVRPFAFGTPFIAGAMLLGGQTIQGFGNTIYNIGYSSLSQSLTPDSLLGRVNATGLFLSFGLLSFGALSGGFLGEWLGLRTSIFISSGGMLVAVLWLARSSLRDANPNLSDIV